MKTHTLFCSLVITAVLIVSLFSIAFADDYKIPITVNGETITLTLTIEGGRPVTVTSAITDVVVGEIKYLNNSRGGDSRSKLTPVDEPVSEVDFTTVCEPENMTDLQKQRHFKSMIGKHVAWTGYVYDSMKRQSGYVVEISNESYEDSWIFTRNIEIRGVPSAIAESLSVNDAVVFSGTIESVESFISDCNPR